MFSLTIEERFLVAGILCALVTGAAVKHWRDIRRESAAPLPAVVEPAQKSSRPR